MRRLTCFKAYDIRGIVPTELNTDIAYDIGRAFASTIECKTVVIGHDIRLTGKSICASLAQGLMDSGIDVIHIGLCGTEEVYFAVQHLHTCAGICVTASHNPSEYNGMKFVGKDAAPIGPENGLQEIKARAESLTFRPIQNPGSLKHLQLRNEYIQKLLTFVSINKLQALKIVVNAGNGGAGLVIDEIEPSLPFDFIKVNHQPDGKFPNGVPNPLLVENRKPTSDAIIKNGADFGVAWDGDFDRCFFFDELGVFVEGYYLVGLLAKTILAYNPNEAIVYDPRLYWSTLNTVKKAGGTAIKTQTGHVFVKNTMRKYNAIYGGEMSAHHYFRDFAYCDNGHIPWLLICQLISTSGKSLSQLVQEAQQAFPCSGEINLTVDNGLAVLAEIENMYAHKAIVVDKLDGLGLEFENWRFNVRLSNTEPLLRINVESNGDIALMREKTIDLITFIKHL